MNTKLREIEKKEISFYEKIIEAVAYLPNTRNAPMQFVISIQTGLSWPMNKADQYFDYIPMVISTGIGFRLGYKPKTEKQL